mgnify:CR=1 FL=1
MISSSSTCAYLDDLGQAHPILGEVEKLPPYADGSASIMVEISHVPMHKAFKNAGIYLSILFI